MQAAHSTSGGGWAQGAPGVPHRGAALQAEGAVAHDLLGQGARSDRWLATEASVAACMQLLPNVKQGLRDRAAWRRRPATPPNSSPNLVHHSEKLTFDRLKSDTFVVNSAVTRRLGDLKSLQRAETGQRTERPSALLRERAPS